MLWVMRYRKFQKAKRSVCRVYPQDSAVTERCFPGDIVLRAAELGRLVPTESQTSPTTSGFAREPSLCT